MMFIHHIADTQQILVKKQQVKKQHKNHARLCRNKTADGGKYCPSHLIKIMLMGVTLIEIHLNMQNASDPTKNLTKIQGHALIY